MSKPTKEQIDKIREIRTKKVIDNKIIRKDVHDKAISKEEL